MMGIKIEINRTHLAYILAFIFLIASLNFLIEQISLMIEGRHLIYVLAFIFLITSLLFFYKVISAKPTETNPTDNLMGS